MNACAVGMFAPAMPARMRAANSIGSDAARPKARYDTADPSNPARMIGRRPKMSDSRPQIGAKMNCISEKLVESSPIDQRRRTEGLGVERQQRDDDAEAEQVDEDRDEDDD